VREKAFVRKDVRMVQENYKFFEIVFINMADVNFLKFYPALSFVGRHALSILSITVFDSGTSLSVYGKHF